MLPPPSVSVPLTVAPTDRLAPAALVRLTFLKVVENDPPIVWLELPARLTVPLFADSPEVDALLVQAPDTLKVWPAAGAVMTPPEIVTAPTVMLALPRSSVPLPDLINPPVPES